MRHHDSANPTEGPAPEGRLGEAISRLLAILASDDMRRWRPRMAIAFLITLASKGFAVASPIAFGEGVNVLTRGVSNGAMASGLFWSAAIMFLAYGLLRFASTGAPQLRDAIFAPVSQDAQRLTAVQGFAHVQTLSLSFHQTKRTGAMNRIIDRGANAVDFLLRFLVFNILPALVELSLAAIVAAVLYGWAFSVIIVVAVIAYAVITGLMTEWRVKLRRQMNEADTEVNARAVDTLTNFETVKAFAAEQREADRFDTAKKRYAEAASKSQQSLAGLNAAQAAIMNGGLLAVALTGAYKVLNGQLEAGDVAALTLMLMNVYQPLNILGWAYREIKQASVDLERLFQTLKLKPEVADKPDAPALVLKGGGVRFEGVSFAHDGRDRSVSEVSFEIAPGSFVGLAGPSGAGKSTLLRLLFRFYDPDEGRVLIDGQDIAGVTQSSLRNALGLVPQDVVLFNDTLRENILYGHPEADEDALWDAVERARLGDFVRSLPKGLETRVGERGLKLSGGEKQRVGVARAILKNPPILILDEATSALDSETESEVQAALAEAARGRTTIAVAHRLSTIAKADQIIVLEDGHVAEQGDHAALLGREGRYAAMWRRQAEAGELA
ncbi:MAG: ABC transporter ATP-binding protein/permease [Oceanicaulis sp.]|uniref:ABCB family ABC transporter ATP-binding protein/permease n=1 Tax=unclassified Oceanicaulis TaxID=2632123 RepID=UPI000066D4D4|nr:MULTISPECIES: ABC transporter ATP-binding protein/permease [unclassified Oceanicaulis]EAP91382.1 ABC transporter, HlyB/MsbA family protein [Oceanicaulis sp. HTCC2633]MBC39029.1 ABC transporter ATP-binding protein/permease [Oceanicaulis sp.]HBU63030.1 ABC transporter ATP-binding protein/permease [Oceanicaulis sp.]|tara:strand:- start:583 stop:2415 length:1833 start_codon:yes stop_codon:yes gene_type:complete